MAITPIDPTAPGTGCPLTAALDTVGGKWAMICLYWLDREPQHFGELRRLMEGISAKVLTETLRNLEGNGLVTRTPGAGNPPPVLYALSPYGQSVRPLIEALRGWGRNHLDRPATPAEDG